MPAFKLIMMEGAAPSQMILSAAKRNPELNKVLENNLIYLDAKYFMQAMTQTYSKENVGIFDYYNLVKDLVIKYHLDEEILCQIAEIKIEDGQTEFPQGWILPKHSLLKKLFDKRLIEISAAGIDHHLVNKHFGDQNSPNICASQLIYVDFSIVGILFYILAFGISSAILLLLLEYLFKKMYKNLPIYENHA